MIKNLIAYSRSVGVLPIFLLVAYLLNPFSLGFIFGYLLILLIVLKANFIKANIDVDFLIIFLFSFIYGLFYSFNPIAGVQYIIVYIFTAPFFYLWGKYLIDKSSHEKTLFYLFLIVGIIISASSLLSVILNVMEGGLAQRSRSIAMIWTGTLTNATGMAAPYIINMAIPAILLSGYKRLSKPVIVIMISVFILSLLCAIRLGSRTQLAITLITLLVILIFQWPHRNTKQNLTIIFVLVMAGFLVYRNVSFDWDADWLSSFAGRMEKHGANELATGGGRTDRWEKSLSNLFTKPLGWGLEEFGFAHNLWLDVARAGGIISLFLLSILTVRVWTRLRKFIKKYRSNLLITATVLTGMLAFTLLFLVDVIMDGSYYLFATFFLLYGAIIKYYHRDYHKGAVNSKNLL